MSLIYIDVYDKFIRVQNEVQYRCAIRRFKKDLYDKDGIEPNFVNHKTWFVFINHSSGLISVTKEAYTMKLRTEIK